MMGCDVMWVDVMHCISVCAVVCCDVMWRGVVWCGAGCCDVMWCAYALYAGM